MSENKTFLLGLDFGTMSARGVLLDAENGQQAASAEYAYPQGIIRHRLKDGSRIDKKFVLQDATDYLKVTRNILACLAKNRTIESIGLCFTASSPMPADENGVPLSVTSPENPHAYVKLWKHAAARKYIQHVEANARPYLNNFGGRVSGEWLLAKATEMWAEAPALWEQCDKFIEAGDWLVWQLCGQEKRSMDFAAFKAQFQNVPLAQNHFAKANYPAHVVDGLNSRLTAPFDIGTAAGALSSEWRNKFHIKGPAIVAVAVIDSHAILPATGHVESGTFVGALGTSAVYLQLSRDYHPLPAGIEGMAMNAAVKDLWCYEAGQAAFGDTLTWYLKSLMPEQDEAPDNNNFGHHPDSEAPLDKLFTRFNAFAGQHKPAENSVLALDWWHGNRVPFADNHLSGMMLGLKTTTTTAEIYCALMESVCFGARHIRDLFIEGDIEANRVIMSSGLARKNPQLIQMMSDIFAQTIEVPLIENGTAVGAAIHGAVAAEVVSNYDEGAKRYGAKQFQEYAPNLQNAAVYEKRYEQYRALLNNHALKESMHALYKLNHSAGHKTKKAAKTKKADRSASVTDKKQTEDSFSALQSIANHKIFNVNLSANLSQEDNDV